MIFLPLVAAAMAVATWFLGWWAVPAIALVIGIMRGSERTIAARVALAAMIAWAALLGIDAAAGPMGRVMTTLGGAMEVPGIAVLAVTLVFPGLLAWSAATVGGTLGRLRPRPEDVAKAPPG